MAISSKFEKHSIRIRSFISVFESCDYSREMNAIQFRLR